MSYQHNRGPHAFIVAGWFLTEQGSNPLTSRCAFQSDKLSAEVMKSFKTPQSLLGFFFIKVKAQYCGDAAKHDS